MVRIDLNPAPLHGGEIRAMRPLAGAIDVLREAALVALDDVVAAMCHRTARRQSERQQAEDRGLLDDREPLHSHTGHLRLPSCAEQLDPMSAAQQSAHEATRGRLDATVK